MVRTRATAACVMDRDTIKQAVHYAIKELSTKSYFDTIVETLEGNLSYKINATLKSMVTPLNNKLEMLERKVQVYDSHFVDLEARPKKA